MSDEQFDVLAWAKRASEALRACHNWMQGEFSDTDFDRDGKLSEADAAAFSAAYDADKAIAAIALMRGQSEIFAAVRMLLDSAPAHMTPRNAKERDAYKLLRALTGLCNCPGGSKPAQFHAPNCPAREVTKETT